MKKLAYVFLIAILTTLVLTGCEHQIPPPVFMNTASVGSGNTDGPMSVPGAVGLTTDQLDTTLNAGAADNGRPGKSGMKLVNISATVDLNSIAPDVTGPRTLGMWADGKFHIEGYNVSFNGGFQNAGFNEVSVLYYDQLLEGEFTYSARVKVKRAGGVSTGKGLHFGVYSNMGYEEDGEPAWRAAQGSKGLGMFMRAESSVQYRLYYSCNTGSTTAGTGAFGNPILTGLNLTREYIYEISRCKIDQAEPYSQANAQYIYRIFDSKSGFIVFDSNKVPTTTPTTTPYRSYNLAVNSTQHPWGTPIGMHPSLQGPVYAGVCISGSSLEVSQIKIWNIGNPDTGVASPGSTPIPNRQLIWNYENGTGNTSDIIFQTPDTTPAYVPALYLSVAASPRTLSAPGSLGNSVYPDYAVFYSNQTHLDDLTTVEGKIGLIPSFTPAWAEDTISYEYHYLGVMTPGMHPAFSIAGAGIETELNGGKTHSQGVIMVDLDGMTSGQQTVGLFKIVGRDLTLDADKTAIDYSVLQTLPEFYFRVDIKIP